MKTFATHALLIMSMIIPLSCAQPDTISYEWRTAPATSVPELTYYHANAKETRFMYQLTVGDTCQMAMERDVIYVWYQPAGDGISVNVKVVHQ